MGVQITFDNNQWYAQFPEFKRVIPATVSAMFTVATTLIRNDGGGPIRDAQAQQNALYYATAHLIRLFYPPGNNGEPYDFTGRISSATEGSVTVATELNLPVNPGAAWWTQTPYGFAAWQILASDRTMRYFPSRRRRIMNPWPFFR
jgi:hypothetical protein